MGTLALFGEVARSLVLGAAADDGAPAGLSFEQIELLLRLGVSDAKVARIIGERGLSSQPAAEHIGRVEARYAAPLTVSALRRAPPP